MLRNIVLDYDREAELVNEESLLSYDGNKDLSRLMALQAVADTRELSLSYLGDLLPNLQKLRLNNSRIATIRDISSSLVNLKFLSLAHCGITNLDGIATISGNLEELYLAFNLITDISDLIGLPKLTVLDLEENGIASCSDAQLLSSNASLRALTLIGNPVAESESYRMDIMKAIPQLVWLDEKRLKEKVRRNGSTTVIAPIESGTNSRNDTVKKVRTDENVVTELVEDQENCRPPTSRAYYGTSSFGNMSLKRATNKRIVTPKPGRPMSSSKAVRIRTESNEIDL
jgi:Leucine-rich repeat (LRR) protein